MPIPSLSHLRAQQTERKCPGKGCNRPVCRVGLLTRGVAPAAPSRIPAPVANEQAAPATSETAVLAGGCFWGGQGVLPGREWRNQHGSSAGHAGGGARHALRGLSEQNPFDQAEAKRLTRIEPTFADSKQRRKAFGPLAQRCASVIRTPSPESIIPQTTLHADGHAILFEHRPRCSPACNSAQTERRDNAHRRISEGSHGLGRCAVVRRDRRGENVLGGAVARAHHSHAQRLSTTTALSSNASVGTSILIFRKWARSSA